jgi:hypothetical protein|tara:strand:- start:409 stop:2220 length:1812 start_codon:yes stop_codon:yes gene_type:complete
MPIAKIQLPDGRIARFEVPEGTTQDQVMQFASQQQFDKPQDPSFLSKVGTATVEGLAGFTEGLGRAAVGATQLGAELLGQEEFAGKIGQQIAKEKELEKDDSTARKVGRFIGGIAPALPVGAGMGLIKGGIAGGAAAELIQPTEEGTAKERVQQTAIGAGLGGLTGGALLGAGKTIKGTAGLVKRQFVATKPEDIIAKGIRPEDAQPILDKLQEGKISVIPDVAGDEVKGLTRSIAKLPQARDVVTDALEQRSFGAVKRVSEQLSKDISPVGAYFGNIDDLAKARGEIAAPLYEKAFKQNTTLDINKNRELFNKIAPDIADAKNKFRLSSNISDNSIVMLDAAKKSLDDKIGKAIRQGERQEASILQGIKKELVSKLDQLNPDYKKARQVFSDFASIQNAQEQGLEIVKKGITSEQVKKMIKEMSVAEKDAFRIGLREGLDRIVRNTSIGNDPAKKIFNDLSIVDKIKAALGDGKKFTDFKKRMQEEIAAADTRFKVLGGSRSDFNLSQDDVLDKIVSGAEVARGGKTELLRVVVNALKNRAAGLNKKNTKQVAEILVNREKGIEALQNIINKEQSKTQQRILKDFVRSLRPELLGSQALQND